MTTDTQTTNWTAFDKDDNPLAKEDRAWWSDQNGYHRPRTVTVEAFDQEEGIIICRDHCNVRYMTIPEELSKTH